MIKNERQYRITKAQAQNFEQALVQLDQSAAKQENPLLWQVQRDAIESQLNDLQEELEEYEALTSGSADRAIALTLHSLRELPAALIKARIAAKLTQKALADQLGLQEQQIQRYEATEYASANLSRIIEVSETLGLRLELKGDLAVGVGQSH
jgi:DNA-binding XRE family transcriptional regulator